MALLHDALRDVLERCTGTAERQQDRVILQVVGSLRVPGAARIYYATDGHVCLRLEASLSQDEPLALGTYWLDEDEPITPPGWVRVAMTPKHFDPNERPCGKWSFGPKYLDLIARLEKALAKAQVDFEIDHPLPRDLVKAIRLRAQMDCVSTFQLGGVREPMRVDARSKQWAATLWIMPRRID